VRVVVDGPSRMAKIRLNSSTKRVLPFPLRNTKFLVIVTEQSAKVESEKPAPVSKPSNGSSIGKVAAADQTQPKSTPSRRTYSISNDVEIEAKVTPRLPRIGWQNNRQHFSLSEEGDVPLKEHSPIRLPRVGQAPRREFSFSNLAEAAKSQEPASRKPKQATTYELIGGDTDEVAKQTPSTILADVAEEETPKPKSRTQNSRLQHETIFHDADTTVEPPKKPSIGGGVGGVRPEETIFVELAEDSNPFIQPKKTTIRRDQQTHFSFNDESPPSTPIARTKHSNLQHFSIEGTPDPHEAEYRARALQRKEVNHFRPDTVPHFEFVDKPAGSVVESKRENSESMNKLLKTIGKSWNVGSDSPDPAKEYGRSGVPKKGLTPHFSFGDSPQKGEEEKENGRGGGGQAQPTTKRYTTRDTTLIGRLQVPVKSEEKEWWEN